MSVVWLCIYNIKKIPKYVCAYMYSLICVRNIGKYRLSDITAIIVSAEIFISVHP